MSELSVADWSEIPQAMYDGLPPTTHRHFPLITNVLAALHPLVSPQDTAVYWMLHKEFMQGILSAIILAEQVDSNMKVVPDLVLAEHQEVVALYTIFATFNELMQRLFGEKQS